jgi:hypothetical protein
MGKIHLNRARQSLGQFTPQEIADGLKNGTFLPTDLAWREGMEAWKPLAEFSDLPEPSVIATPPDLAEPEPPLFEASPPPEAMPAWENRAQIGFFTAVANTVRQVLAEPSATFRRMRTEGGLLTPLIYFLVVGWAMYAVSLIYNLIYSLVEPESLGEAQKLGVPVLVTFFAVVIVLLPVLLTVGGFMMAGLWHVSVMLIAGSKRTFEATFRIVCYAAGSTSILLLVPMCGNLLYSLWCIVALVIGFREVHETSTFRATISVLIPLLLCCACAFVSFSGVIALAAAVGAEAGLPSVEQ